MKRVFIFHIALLLAMGLYAYDFKYGDLYYNITSDSTVEVTYEHYGSGYNYQGLSSISIPETVANEGKTYRVTSIGYQAFMFCHDLTSVTIGNSVTSIGGSAFYGGYLTSSVTIPNSVTSIGYRAFDETPWYNNQPDGVVYIGKVLYKYKGTMPDNTSINIPDGIVSITASAFKDCTGLIAVTIGDDVTTIGGGTGSSYYHGDGAFNHCTNLVSITIGKGVKNIGIQAFLGCDSLKSVYYRGTLTDWIDINFDGYKDSYGR
mgnify:CR=1 FL=1